MPLPGKLSFEEGAAFPVIYLTAYMMMFNLGNFQKDETILIHGAGGGVGTAAIQLAQAVGGNIIGTASKWKHQKLHEMGVEHCIDYTNENVHEKVMRFTSNRGVDLILDPVGSHNWKISYECLSPLGKMIIFGDQNFVKGKSFNFLALMKEMFSMPKYKPMDLMSKNKSVMGYHLGRLAGAEDKIQKAASKLHDLAQTEKIKPIIDQIFSFTDAPKAHEHIQNRKNFGKVLLDFNDK
jgi:NADPH:quinone reductase-like Zn-dependent oxidoreductase